MTGLAAPAFADVDNIGDGGTGGSGGAGGVGSVDLSCTNTLDNFRAVAADGAEAGQTCSAGDGGAGNDGGAGTASIGQ
jgi:hypothetical protein